MKKRSVCLTGTVASLAEMVTGASHHRPGPLRRVVDISPGKGIVVSM